MGLFISTFSYIVFILLIHIVTPCLLRIECFTVLSKYDKALFICRQSRLTSSCRRAGTSFQKNSSAIFIFATDEIKTLCLTNRAASSLINPSHRYKTFSTQSIKRALSSSIRLVIFLMKMTPFSVELHGYIPR